jgi:hypothetical protein
MRATRGRGEYNSEARLKQRRQPADVEENIPSYFLQSPQALARRLVLGIASCRMITALCPLEAVALSRRSPAFLTVDQRRRTNQLLLHQNN